MEKLKVGDVVVLKSDHLRRMTISREGYSGGQVECLYWVAEKIQADIISPDALIRVEDLPKKT